MAKKKKDTGKGIRKAIIEKVWKDREKYVEYDFPVGTASADITTTVASTPGINLPTNKQEYFTSVQEDTDKYKVTDFAFEWGIHLEKGIFGRIEFKRKPKKKTVKVIKRYQED